MYKTYMKDSFLKPKIFFQYLGTEHRRNNSRRRNTSNIAPPPPPPPALEDITRPEHRLFENGGEGGGGDGDTRGDEGNILGEQQQNNWLIDAQSIDFQNPNLVFGNLLDEYPLEGGGGETHAPRRINPLREFRVTSRSEYPFL